MPLPSKPASKPLWTYGNPGARIEPSPSYKTTGWFANQRPPYQFMNWLFENISEWIDYFDSSVDFFSTVIGGINLTKEVPSGVVDGVNPDFIITGTPTGGKVVPLIDGSADLNSEYTYNQLNHKVTFLAGSIPTTGQSVEIMYMQGGGTSIVSNSSYVPYGDTVTPQIITAVGGIAATNDARQAHFIKSNGGAVVITSNPQISPGIAIGQEMMLIGTSDTDYITIDDGTGVSLNGPSVDLKNAKVLSLLWNGVAWRETSRS